jgi:hypothetical protein
LALKKFFAVVVTVLSCALFFAEQPYWWNNPHKDDEFAMYERGSSTGASSEQDATRAAILAAKSLIVERIGIGDALDAAGLSRSPEYAVVNFEVVDTSTEKTGKTWGAWVLIKYPQEEKKKILDRWNASLASIKDLKKQEDRIPLQFPLTLKTADGRAQYRDGERLVFTVRADEDCYLVLLDHQSDGTTVLLFPNRFQKNAFVKKGQSVTIPAPDSQSFALVVGAPYGDDRVEAIAATKQSELHKRFADILSGISDGQNMAVVSRGIFVQGLSSAIDGSSDAALKWSCAELNLSTFAK